MATDVVAAPVAKDSGLVGGLGVKAAALVAAVAVLVGGGTLGYLKLRPEAPVTTVLTADPARPGRTTAPLTAPPPTALPTATQTAKAKTPSTTSTKPTTKTRTTSTTIPFSTTVPAVPVLRSSTRLGSITQNTRVAGRDNGQSTLYGKRSVWLFADTTLKNPFGFLSNSGAATTDLKASDGIRLTSGNPVTEKSSQTPVQLIPLTPAEKAFEKAHSKSRGCTTSTDPYCGTVFGFWPGPVISDPARGRTLVFYGKLCRGAAEGTPCSGPMGKALGTGIAAIDMRTGKVTRLAPGNGPAVNSVEGRDKTLFFPAGTSFNAAALVVNGDVYAYGDCSWGCKVGRVALSSVTNRAAWRFWTGSTWSSSEAAGKHLIDPGAAGQTVFYDPALHAFLNVYMPYGSNTARYQIGGSPYGPWSAPHDLGVAPGTGNYALHGHPEYAEKNGLVQYLSYYNPGSGEQRLMRVEFAA